MQHRQLISSAITLKSICGVTSRSMGQNLPAFGRQLLPMSSTRCASRSNKAIKRMIFIFILLAFSMQGGWCFEPAINEFRRHGPELVCTSDSFDPKWSPAYLPCLMIGSLRIGQPQKEVEAALGNPWKVIDNGADGLVKVFVIESTKEVKPYWVVIFKSGFVDSLQITGEPDKKGYSFSSVSVGMKKSQVVKILGQPTESTEVDQIGGVLWSYAPFPISIEFIEDKVSSIKIWKG